MKSSKLRWLLLVGLIVVAAVGLIVYLSTPAPGARLAGPMVQQLTADSFMLVGEIHGDVPVALRVREADGGWVDRGRHTPTDRRYEIAVDGLKPDTAYDYELAPATEPVRWRVESRVTTAPRGKGTFRMMAFGDSGWGEQEQFDLADRICAYRPRLCVHTGDLIYMDGERADYYPKFYRPYAELLARTAFYPCVGNHDYITEQGQPMFENFVLPANGPEQTTPERHYWFDFGGVRFIAFDSDVLFSEIEQHVTPWMEKVLADAGDRWKIVFFHHPVFTSSKHQPSGKILQLLVPLFDRYGVQLVLVGHNHLYERTRPIRRGEVVEDGRGTVYVTTGAGGARLYPPQPDKPDFMVFQTNGSFSFTIIDVTPEQLTLQQIDQDDKVIDTATIPFWTPATAATVPAEPLSMSIPQPGPGPM